MILMYLLSILSKPGDFLIIHLGSCKEILVVVDSHFNQMKNPQ